MARLHFRLSGEPLLLRAMDKTPSRTLFKSNCSVKYTSFLLSAVKSMVSKLVQNLNKKSLTSASKLAPYFPQRSENDFKIPPHRLKLSKDGRKVIMCFLTLNKHLLYSNRGLPSSWQDC